jgi:hypothetical protein
MGWDKGRYYTRSRKVNGRVVREYYGAGEAAELIAELNALEREERDLRRLDQRALRDELDALDGSLGELHTQAELLARVALAVAGFHQHHRGEWRKRRDARPPAEPAGADRPEGSSEGAGPRPAGG